MGFMLAACRVRYRAAATAASTPVLLFFLCSHPWDMIPKGTMARRYPRSIAPDAAGQARQPWVGGGD